MHPYSIRRSATLVLLAAVVGCAAPADAPTAPAPSATPARSASAALPLVGATMRFGRPDMNAFAQMSPSAMPHTQAGHAVDRVFPGTVVIARGQTVAFESFPVHQIAVYAPGTRPADIRVDAEHLADAETPWGTFPDVLIDDPANRLALSPISFERMTWTPDAATFDRPGRYLVICTLVFHFVPTNMYGWVEVR
ncbi:hypothetical protein [Roseisolibacter agri]|uniref:DM13 domain-containing protein n=1 Tax=Roseisolibacter agri TaxID=2014610 RepID=A0AA37Q7L3_9BACT|nr:hypothetical protein [Roseisolibacter agri]GLC23841.1 hypothetical protein rosag_03540 [Roseisolibacter agri]